jgi:hypothetical protein
MNRTSRFATTVVVSGSLGLAGLGLGLGTAQADPSWGPSYGGGNCPPGIGTCTHWCPGDPPIPGSEFGVISWDWNICHDWYWNSEGTVDIASNTIYPWRGVPHEAPPPPPPPGPPPPAPPRPAHCPPWNVIIGPSECGGL